MSEVKTNVMRILERQKIAYNHYCYEGTGAVSGIEVAAALGEDADRVFKTLVTVSRSRRYYVFMIPVAAELNLKKAAAAVGEKDVEMLKQKDLLPLTGYVHGGCSPIGMKKQFPTVVHNSAENYATIIYSAGKVGYQVETSLAGLRKVIGCATADIIMP
ncbi:MAG: Cys-tRNA(Pro) deacylase [Alphaproteobacteria bacterium]|jgi:ybaK/ebsC protein|nr:Cys-tRNA(Pro) deacylase [Alphaproteobacteria bacterium]MBS6995484.1 Cys-tRNA(Pro) deacylase [Azospirillum sp.]CDB52822.1 ybaK/EbsC family protein [Azospirillum sp. CAG:239]